ncbi:MAG TPA: hypothetical protein VMU81_00395 [Acetobacteraceae bacterium]|nr:hypothetical protein [Acetobacteraceae bacterium]
MPRSILTSALLLVLLAPAALAGANPPAPVPDLPNLPGPPPPSVTLTINPDGSAIWDGQPLTGVPDLQDKLAHKTLQDPKLELDLHFHTVSELGESNRQTLLEVLELAAKFGYVHVQATTDGAKLTVLGPTAVDSAPK